MKISASRKPSDSWEGRRSPCLEARNIEIKKQGNELAQAKAIVHKADQALIKAKRKALLAAVATTRSDMVKTRTTQ